jgi:hypothetical protein
VFPASPEHRRNNSETASLVAANGTKIRAWGNISSSISLRSSSQGPKLFNHDFIVADVAEAILGSDFFVAFGLAINMRGRRLYAMDHGYLIYGAAASLSSVIAGLRVSSLSRFEFTLADYPEVLIPTFSSNVNKHGVEHHVPTKGPPVFARARRLDAAKLAMARAEFEKMEAMGIIRPWLSPWASPLHMVPKPDGT